MVSLYFYSKEFRRKHEIIRRTYIERRKCLGREYPQGRFLLDPPSGLQTDERDWGRLFADRFKDAELTKVVTIEASGIAPALYVAEALELPMIFAKKAKNITMNEGILTAEVYSFTKQVTSTVSIAGKFLSPDDRVLIIDDFLANGQAAKGLIQIIEQAGARVEAVGIVIEKSFQDGRGLLEKLGYPVVSLARLDRFENGQVVFKEADI